jgi:uroporphyrinogen-III synthase
VSLPLAGRRILITRRPEQSGALAAALRDAGATVLELPLLEIGPPGDWGPLDAALQRLLDYDWLVLTSSNTVRAVRSRLDDLGLAAASVGHTPRVASIGPATSDAFRAAFPGADVALAPTGAFRAEGLLAAFRSRGAAGERFLLPTSDRAGDVLPIGLREAGGVVEVVTAYRTLVPADLSERLARILLQGMDMALFASPSAVDAFCASAGPAAARLPAGVIGPVTRRRAEAAGLDVRVEAQPSTSEGLLSSLISHFRPDS